ncbi:dipeptide epimerase [Rurimicrobium arvi]|uniref:Dipeptide epimerase n=1 Tax=Rurimicrobium arvi TaxID=2049916 RepID=A0ABP8MWW6_9BACT
MLQLASFRFELPFEYPFTIAKGTKTRQPSLVVSLGLRHWRGFGEAPAISYYNVTVDAMAELLQEKSAMISRYAMTDPQRFWHFLHHLIPGNNFLIAALDIAGWDLFAQMRNMPLRYLLGAGPERVAPITDYTLGIDTVEQMLAKARRHPWPVYKIKVNRAEDLDLLIRLRAETESPFRLDANEGLDYDTVLRLLPEWQKLGVELVEQPLPKGEWEAMKELKKRSSIPFFADESCVEESDVVRCVDAFSGINIKLTKCGGITPALRMIAEARKRDLKVMLGSMNETTIGTAAMVHLSPLADFLDADGPLLLSEDIAEGLHYEQGRVTCRPAPGLGIRFLGQPRQRSYFEN